LQLEHVLESRVLAMDDKFAEIAFEQLWPGPTKGCALRLDNQTPIKARDKTLASSTQATSSRRMATRRYHAATRSGSPIEETIAEHFSSILVEGAAEQAARTLTCKPRWCETSGTGGQRVDLWISRARTIR
jgi:hypothetical protein